MDICIHKIWFQDWGALLSWFCSHQGTSFLPFYNISNWGCIFSFLCSCPRMLLSVDAESRPMLSFLLILWFTTDFGIASVCNIRMHAEYWPNSVTPNDSTSTFQFSPPPCRFS
jgi:hypothetical protein